MWRLSKQEHSQRKLKGVETQGSLGECFIYSTWNAWLQMSPLGGIYTYPPPQWTVEIDLIQRLILILQNTPYKYLRYLQA